MSLILSPFLLLCEELDDFDVSNGGRIVSLSSRENTFRNCFMVESISSRLLSNSIITISVAFRTVLLIEEGTGDSGSDSSEMDSSEVDSSEVGIPTFKDSTYLQCWHIC